MPRSRGRGGRRGKTKKATPWGRPASHWPAPPPPKPPPPGTDSAGTRSPAVAAAARSPAASRRPAAPATPVADRPAPEPVDLTRLEQVKRAYGLLPAADDRDPGVAVWLAEDGFGQPLATCTCRAAGCRHRRELLRAIHDLERLAGADAEAAFAASLPGRLAVALVDGGHVAADRCRATEGAAGVRIDDGGGTVLVEAPAGAAGRRLVERLGLGAAASSARARLRARLTEMQESAYHVVLNARGFETIGQRRERSLWWQVLSHAFREDPKGSGEAALAVDGATGVVSLRLGAAAGALTLLPRPAAVEGVLAVLAAARPGQAELEPRSVPVRWVHVLRPAGDGSGRIDVRPFLEARLPGPHRFPLDELRPFLHGTLVWLGPVGAFVRLPAGKLPAAATAGPDELPELLDGIARDHGDEAVEATEGVGPARLFRRPDGVSVRPAVEGWDWLDLRYRFGRGSVALRDLLAARRAGRRYLGVGDGWVDLASDDLTAADQDLAAALPGERRQASPLELLRLQARTGGVFQVEGEGEEAARLRALVELRPLRPYAPPPGLASTLRPYQERGVEWLRFLWDNGLGGLLCDDMGLGKTHQTLALLLQLRAEGVREPSLVVCPTSVLSHWRDKARAHAPGLRVALHHGAERSLDDAVAASDLVVASYGVLRRDADRLRAIRFAVVAFDEAQNLKGRGTQVHQAARQLDARLRLGLTGTPVENSVADLKALLDLTLPGYLGSDLAFERRYLGGDGAPVAPWRLDELRRLTAPFALRRLKDAVLAELPDKVVDRRTCALSDQQAALYREAIQGRGRALVARLERRDEAVPYVHVFALIDLLKQVCDHPALATGQLERAEEMASGKWELFVELLDEALGSGHKVVVFSQYLGMLELMARHLDRLQVGHARLTGQSRNRGELVRRFNDDADCRVFLASLLAGGTGIDLVGGSVVIHYDRWWNAAREDQATDRVHRIGQRRSVQVFKLVTEGTLEERIEAIVERKRALLAAVVRPDDPEVGKALTRDELLDILRPL